MEKGVVKTESLEVFIVESTKVHLFRERYGYNDGLFKIILKLNANIYFHTPRIAQQALKGYIVFEVVLIRAYFMAKFVV